MTDDALKEFNARLDKWALQVGRFILWFGNVDHNTALLWQHLRPETQTPILKKRLDGIRKDLKAIDGTDELLKAIDRAEALRDLRNDIAHNTMSIETYEDTDGTPFSCCVVNGPTSKYRLTIEDIESLVEQAHELSVKLSASLHPFLRRYYTSTV